MWLGSKALSSLDPFDDIDLLIEQFDVSTAIKEQIEGYLNDTDEDENDKHVWVLPEKQSSAFDIYDNFDDEKEL